MEKCTNCGANPLPGSETCAYCGHALPQPKPPEPVASPPAPSAFASQSSPSPGPAHFGASPAGPGGPPPPGPWGTRPVAGFGPSQPLGTAWPTPVDSPNFMLWIVLGAISFFICQGSVVAVIGTIFAIMAKNEWERGNHAVSENKLRTARILIIVNFILIAFLFFVYIFAIAAAEMS